MYCIQRCKKKEKFKTGMRVSQWLQLDYMGSAEFEFGAVPECLRNFNALIEKLVIESHVVNKKSIYFLCTPAQVASVREALDSWGKNLYKPRLQETISVPAILQDTEKFYQDDFWFDIDDNIAFSFEQKDLQHFKQAFTNSVVYMDEQKALREKEKIKESK